MTAWQPARSRISELAVLAAVPAAHSHLAVPRTVLLIIVIAAVWVLTLLVRPFGKCWLCRGKRVRVVKGRRKARKCWACKDIPEADTTTGSPVGARQRTLACAVARG